MQQACTTDQSNFGNILSTAPWFRVPYPGQWGAPLFTGSCERAPLCRHGGGCERLPWRPDQPPARPDTLLPRPSHVCTAAVLTFLAAVIPAALESIGDYFAAARLANAPPPPPDVVSRALAVESVCCVVSGLFGTTSGSTAYAGERGRLERLAGPAPCSRECCLLGLELPACRPTTVLPSTRCPPSPPAENVGAIAITGVASRRVVQLGAGMMICIACLGKFGALFASIPQALVAGLLVVLFSLIAGVGERVFSAS